MEQATPRKRSFRSITNVMRHIQIYGADKPLHMRELNDLIRVVAWAKQKGNKLAPDILKLIETCKAEYGPGCMEIKVAP